MILFWRDDGRTLCEALDWSVYTLNGERVRLESEAALVDHLRAHPDTQFYLWNYRLRKDMAPHREIEAARAADYGPGSGHIFCGVVRYDSAAGAVLSDGV